jgi:hypothetical protein
MGHNPPQLVCWLAFRWRKRGRVRGAGRGGEKNVPCLEAPLPPASSVKLGYAATLMLSLAVSLLSSAYLTEDSLLYCSLDKFLNDE